MIINICLLMATLSFSNCDKKQYESYSPSGDKKIPVSEIKEHLTIHSTIADVLTHPAFDGFSRYILPLEWGYDADMQLSNVSRLLPYHNYIDAERCVGYINQMIDSVATGRSIYYDLGHEDAGLFFFRERPNAPFAVICPGGGFSYVGSIHEGFPHALVLSQMDIMFLLSNIRLAVRRLLAKTWLQVLSISSVTPRNCKLIQLATPCGAVQRERVWRLI